MKQVLLLFLALFFFTSCVKENSFEIVEKEFIEEISLNTDPWVFVNFIKVHKISEKADLERLAEIYTLNVFERAKRIEHEFRKNNQLETRGTPCFGAYHTRSRINTVEMVFCTISSYGILTMDCYEDFIDDQEQAMADFAQCIEETYP